MPKKNAIEKQNVGRPRTFNTVKELEACIELYKDYLKQTDKPPTIAGLAYYTGISRQSIYNYKERDEYFGTIKSLVDWILMTYEELAITSSGGGIIFLLKNYGYTDKQEIQQTGKGIDVSIQWDNNPYSNLTENELRQLSTIKNMTDDELENEVQKFER